MIENYGELSGLDYSLGETAKLHLSVRSSEGQLMFDVRKWFKFPNQDSFVPSKKGICISFKQWNEVIPIIQAEMAKNAS